MRRNKRKRGITMKILHTADWHLGIDLHKVSLLEDQKYALWQIKKIVMEEDVDVIVIAGDVYDTTLASKEAIELYNRCMSMLCLELQKQVIVIAGNHDSAVRLATCAELLAPMGLHIYGKLEEKVKGLRIKDTMFYPIPYLHPAQVAQVYEQPCATQEEAFRIICEDIHLHKEKNLCHAAIAHAFIAGSSVCESDRFARVGGSDLVPATLFEEFDYVALGHLHRPQKVGEHVYYSGSLLPYSFSEAEQQKQVLLYDTCNQKVYARTIEPLHPLYVLKGSLSYLQQLRQVDDGYPQGYVKLQLLDVCVSYEMLTYFQEHYPGLLQLSGKNEQIKSKISLDVEQLDGLNDVNIVKRYFQDMFQETLCDEDIQLLQEGLSMLEEV